MTLTVEFRVLMWSRRVCTRRDCIWKRYGEENGIGKEWWDYVNEFMLRCDNEEYFANDECANDCLSHAGIDQAGIESCMSDSGGLDDDTTNTILEVQLADNDGEGRFGGV